MQAGDEVSWDGGYGRYTVLAVHGAYAWLENGAVPLSVPLSRLRDYTSGDKIEAFERVPVGEDTYLGTFHTVRVPPDPDECPSIQMSAGSVSIIIAAGMIPEPGLMIHAPTATSNQWIPGNDRFRDA